MTRLSTFALAALTVILPFAVTNRVVDPSLLPTFIALAAGLVSLGLLLIVFDRGHLDYLPQVLRHPVTIPLVVYVVAVAVSVLWSRNRGDAILSVGSTVLWAGAIVVAAQILSSRERAARFLALGQTLAAAGLVLLALSDYYGVNIGISIRAADLAATQSNRNLLASALCLLMPGPMLLVFSHRQALATTSLAVVGFATATIVLANARASWLALLAGLLVCAVLGLINLRRGGSKMVARFYRRRATAMLIVLIAVVVLFTPGWLRHDDQLSAVDRAAESVNWKGGSIGERLALWSSSAEMIKVAPLQGLGVGDWKLEVPRYGSGGLRSSGADIFYQRPHNDYLWVWAESGVFAFLGYVAVLLAAGWRLLRAALKMEERRDRLQAILALCGLVAFMTVSALSFPRERPLHLWLAAIYVAHAVAADYQRRELWSLRQRSVGLLVALLIVVAGAAGVAYGVVRFNSEKILHSLQDARRNSDWPLVVQRANRVNRDVMPVDGSSTPIIWYRGIAYYETGRLDLAMADFREATQVHPYHIHALNNLGTCFELQQQHDSAIAYYRRALDVIPNYTPTLLNLTAAYYNAGQLEAAAETIEKVDPECDDARYPKYRDAVRSRLNSAGGSD